MAEADKLIGFLAFRRDEEGDITNFVVSPDRDGLDKWKAGSSRSLEETNVTPDVEEVKKNLEDPAPKVRDRVAGMLDRFRKSMTSVHSMIDFTSAVAPSMAHYFINQKLATHARKNLKVVQDDGVVSVYEISGNGFSDIRSLLDEFDIDKQGFDALPSATLLSLVATFDSYFSEVVRFFLSVHPERYTGSDKPISLKEIFAKKNLEEAVLQVIDNEINNLMRGSHTDQVQFIESHLDIKIIGHYERWPNFVEIFERRNLVAHGNLVVNEPYIVNCKSAKYKDIEKLQVGEQLSLTPRYLHRATDVLSEFGILLVFVLWRKHITNSGEDAFRYINQTSYNIIHAKRSRLAQRLLEFALYKQRHDCSDLIVRMMLINLANTHKKMRNDVKCQEVISSMDWTASDDNFQICIASLEGDVEKVVSLMPGLAARKGPDARGINANSFRAWPIFDWVRDDPKINETFERVYGEPMRSKVADAVTSVKTSEVQEPEAGADVLSTIETGVTRH